MALKHKRKRSDESEDDNHDEDEDEDDVIDTSNTVNGEDDGYDWATRTDMGR